METGKIELDIGELQRWANETTNLRLDFLQFKFWAEGEILSLSVKVAKLRRTQSPPKKRK